MVPFVKSPEFKKLNVGFGMDEGGALQILLYEILNAFIYFVYRSMSKQQFSAF